MALDHVTLVRIRAGLPFSAAPAWPSMDLCEGSLDPEQALTLATGWTAWVARHAWRDRERTLRWSAASGGCALAMMLLVALEKV